MTPFGVVLAKVPERSAISFIVEETEAKGLNYLPMITQLSNCMRRFELMKMSPFDPKPVSLSTEPPSYPEEYLMILNKLD